MNKIFSKIIIGTLVAGFFLLPVSVTIRTNHEKNVLLSMEENTAKAQVTDLTVTLDDAHITAGLVTPFVKLVGSIKPGENLIWFLYLNDSSNGSALIQGDFTSIAVIDTAVGVPIQYGFEEGKHYYVGFHTKVNGVIIKKLGFVEFDFTTKPGGSTNIEGKTDVIQPKNPIGCDLLDPTSYFANCIVYMVYTLIFTPMAWFAELAAKVLDFFIYYSTDDNSYRGTFVEGGWGVVRDVANIFFIIALLYVAFQTILSIGHSDGKKMIGMIIMIALIINFSLFATKVVIDASNILAKIFYNNITPVGANGQDVSTSGGQKSISVGLVSQFNPQDIFNNSKDENGKPLSIAKNIGLFFGVVLIGIALMGYMIYMFLSVTMLFVARVVSLWIAMIFAPLAFASKTVSFDIGSMGMAKWSSELFKNAFLAPIFIFFLYIIISFGKVMNIVTYGTTDTVIKFNTFETYMKALIPFIIIFALLMKAKKLAEEYSGEMGEAMTKAGGMVAGAALGGTALLGRATVGRLGNYVAESDWAKKAESKGVFGAASLRNLGKAAGKGSMDIRGLEFAGVKATGSALGGPSGVGGWAKAKHDKVTARQKRADELKVGHDGHLMHELHGAEENHQGILRKEVTDADGKVIGNAQKLDELKLRTDSALEKQRDWNNKANSIDTVDEVKRKEKDAALAEAQAMPETTDEEMKRKQLAIQKAQAMVITDPKKLAEQLEAKGKANEQAALALKFRAEKDAIKDANFLVKADGTIYEGYVENTDNGKASRKAIETIEELSIKATKDSEFAKTDAVRSIEIAKNSEIAITKAENNLKTKEAEAAAAKSASMNNLGDEKLKAAADDAAKAEQRAKEEVLKAKEASEKANKAITTKKAAADEAAKKAENYRKVAEKYTKAIGKEIGEEWSKEKWEEKVHEGVVGSSVNDYEDVIIPGAKNAIDTEDKERMWDYAQDIHERSNGIGITRITNLFNGGQSGAHEAVNNIRRGAKFDSSGGGSHGGGGGGGGGHSAPKPKPKPAPSGGGGGGGGGHGGGHH